MPIAELEAPFHCRYFFVAEAYLDETERLGPIQRLFGMGAWLGSGTAWRPFEQRWSAVLNDARFSISEFKSTDFKNRRGEFNGWQNDRCSGLLSALLEVIKDAEILGVEVTLSMSQPEDPRASVKSGGDYRVCAAHCMALLAHIAAIEYVDGYRVAFLFDEREKSDLQNVKSRIKAELPPRLAKRIGPVGFDTSHEVLPLQAADLLAYWAYLRREHELGRSSEWDIALLGVLSPILSRKLAVRKVLTWEPGVLEESTSVTDARWDIVERLPSLGFSEFEKPQMPETTRQAIADAAWRRLKDIGRRLGIGH